jgi:GNAT superfamily N-acetyltransferase
VSEEEKSYSFRPYEADDRNFISNSWDNSYYTGANYNLYLKQGEFNNRHRPIREKFFANPNTAVIVCCSKKEPGLIIGWIAVEKMNDLLVLHYLYVKEMFKGEGVARELLRVAYPVEKDREQIVFTHLTEKASLIKIKKNKYKYFFYAPHLI